MNSNFKLILKNKIQSLGSQLSSMIMPIIGIFIAWGLLTSFFIPTGWFPNETLASMVGIGILYVIPILIAFLGGHKIYGLRGGAIAGLISIAAIAAGQSTIFQEIVGTSSPMILASMIFGPLAALLLKHTEKFWINKIKPGYEMLINNFYLGILGFVLLFIVFYSSIYIIGYLNVGLSHMVASMRKYKLYPLLAIVIEPAKILFLNNAINHGVFTPLGQVDVTATGKSILFLLESNPGPGLGVLLAWVIFGRKNKDIKSQALSSAPIHLFGGIHEVYFPFVLLKPILILATIAGGVVGNLIFQLFDVGAVAPVSPGSIIAQYIQVKKTALDITGLTIGIFGSAATSLIVSWIILSVDKLFKKNKEEKWNIQETKNKVASLKNKKSTTEEIKIVFACDAGMGSSVMGSSIFKKMLIDKNINNIKVEHKAISNLNNSEEYIITISSLSSRVKEKNSHAKIFELNQFLNKERYLEIISELNNE